MTGYTVVDVETTGLFPQQHDRIVEIALVLVSDTGQVEGEWCTLVNPGRDIGPTSIHGIAAREVLDAPSFGDVAGALVRALTGRTLVAHNARFDGQFLDYEFDRAGWRTTPPVPALCTMQWSTHFIAGASRKLRDCCEVAGVPHHDEHSALGDARAVAGLLGYYLTRCDVPPPWSDVLNRCRTHPWPPCDGPTEPARVQPRMTALSRPDAWLDRITSNMPRNHDPVIEAYLDVLEHAMLDRYLSAHEEKALIEVALSLGLQRDQLTAVHATYLDALAAAALEDGIVTEAERQELDQVAAMLGLPSRLVEVALNRPAADQRVSASGFRLAPGDQVVFTGELSIPRIEWVTRAEAAGLVHGGVKKSTTVVVAADPDSQSGKAAKARSYNIPVVTEDAFARMLLEL